MTDANTRKHQGHWSRLGSFESIYVNKSAQRAVIVVTKIVGWQKMLDHERSLELFVPRFGLLSTTRITLVVLLGVWMIFLPMTIGASIFLVSRWINPPDLFTALISSIVPLFLVVVGTAILLDITRRYIQRNSDIDSREEPTT